MSELRGEIVDLRARIIDLARTWDEESVEPPEDFADALMDVLVSSAKECESAFDVVSRFAGLEREGGLSDDGFAAVLLHQLAPYFGSDVETAD